jgi:hypothetical protein
LKKYEENFQECQESNQKTSQKYKRWKKLNSCRSTCKKVM